MNLAPAQVLVVDDQQAMRDILREGLQTMGYDVATAASAAEARALYASGRRFELALCDIDMPDESGVQLLGWLKQNDPDLAVVMVTGIDDAATAVSAMLAGASDYVCKPFALVEVRARAEQALDKRRLVLENKEYQQRLEELVEDRTREVLQAMSRIDGLNKELKATYDRTLQALMAALDHRDNETQGHSVRVEHYTERLSRALGIVGEEFEPIKRGAMLHDVGKIGIPDAILRKPGKLDAEEWMVMRQHPELGWKMLHDVPFLREAADIVLSHQERYDGAGYPRGLRGEAIPVGARIFAVADTLDAMTSDRPYRKALTYDRARQELIDFSGTQFDPRVVESFLSVPRREWTDIRRRTLTQMSDRGHGLRFVSQLRGAAR